MRNWHFWKLKPALLQHAGNQYVIQDTKYEALKPYEAVFKPCHNRVRHGVYRAAIYSIY